MSKAQKITIAIIVIIILLLIVVITAFISTGGIKLNNLIGDKEQQQVVTPGEELSKKQSEEAALETQKLIDEVKRLAEEVDEKNIEGGDGGFSKVVSIPSNSLDTEGSEEKAIIVAPGSSMVSIETGDVLTDAGVKADNSLDPADPNSPRQSFTIEDINVLPPSTVKLTISDGNIEPAEFKVKAGQVVSLAVTSESDFGDIFRFEDESLNGVSVGIGKDETRSITFNAPDEKGEYVYYSGVRKQKQNGAVGIMIVE